MSDLHCEVRDCCGDVPLSYFYQSCGAVLLMESDAKGKQA